MTALEPVELLKLHQSLEDTHLQLGSLKLKTQRKASFNITPQQESAPPKLTKSKGKTTKDDKWFDSSKYENIHLNGLPTDYEVAFLRTTHDRTSNKQQPRMKETDFNLQGRYVKRSAKDVIRPAVQPRSQPSYKASSSDDFPVFTTTYSESPSLSRVQRSSVRPADLYFHSEPKTPQNMPPSQIQIEKKRRKEALKEAEEKKLRQEQHKREQEEKDRLRKQLAAAEKEEERKRQTEEQRKVEEEKLAQHRRKNRNFVYEEDLKVAHTERGMQTAPEKFDRQVQALVTSPVRPKFAASEVQTSPQRVHRHSQANIMSVSTALHHLKNTTGVQTLPSKIDHGTQAFDRRSEMNFDSFNLQGGTSRYLDVVDLSLSNPELIIPPVSTSPPPPVAAPPREDDHGDDRIERLILKILSENLLGMVSSKKEEKKAQSLNDTTQFLVQEGVMEELRRMKGKKEAAVSVSTQKDLPPTEIGVQVELPVERVEMSIQTDQPKPERVDAFVQNTLLVDTAVQADLYEPPMKKKLPEPEFDLDSLDGLDDFSSPEPSPKPKKNAPPPPVVHVAPPPPVIVREVRDAMTLAVETKEQSMQWEDPEPKVFTSTNIQTEEPEEEPGPEMIEQNIQTEPAIEVKYTRKKFDESDYDDWDSFSSTSDVSQGEIRDSVHYGYWSEGEVMIIPTQDGRGRAMPISVRMDKVTHDHVRDIYSKERLKEKREKEGEEETEDTPLDFGTDMMSDGEFDIDGNDRERLETGQYMSVVR
ncbi:hypothetical protein PROFUN_08371 [Planoprotostelium fungivorum]|uniref:Uncharacterized protein n=2 Tax=Planoprotostelium fungivorum TaxID=1890364 RepID=A0A2P6NJN5_9EUKA|nr:hypothetical protein PROFUN_08371 [Planoprotostelium fungivorum]